VNFRHSLVRPPSPGKSVQSLRRKRLSGGLPQLH
jgi:hypothetical protein